MVKKYVIVDDIARVVTLSCDRTTFHKELERNIKSILSHVGYIQPVKKTEIYEEDEPFNESFEYMIVMSHDKKKTESVLLIYNVSLDNVEGWDTGFLNEEEMDGNTLFL